MEAAATGAGIAASVLWARVLNQSPEHGNEPRREPSLYFHRREPTLYSQCITGGAANAFSSALLNPMDVIKTRMQVSLRFLALSVPVRGRGGAARRRAGVDRTRPPDIPAC